MDNFANLHTQGAYLHQYSANDKMKVKTEWEVKIFDGKYFK